MICEACGLPLLGQRLFQSRRRQEIYEYIRTHDGATTDEIVRHVWADKVDSVENSNVPTQISRMRPTLRVNGWDIYSTMGPGATYHLVKLEAK